MKLIRLGDYIEPVDISNSNLSYDNVKGISITKKLIDTKANMAGVNLKPYKILKKGYFTYCLVTSRNGNKISIAYNDQEDCLVSSINPVFRIKNESELNPVYLYMFFNRTEFDRYARFNSWGSARETFSWEDFCDIKITLPNIDIQNKFVKLFSSISKNYDVYSSNLDCLQFTCNAYIEKLKNSCKMEPIGKYCKLVDRRNKDGLEKNVKGLTVRKDFIETKANMNNISTNNYKVVEVNEIAYVPNTARMSDKFACGLCKERCVVSPVYEIINVFNDELLPDYLFLWFKREEFDRYARFNSWGSVREILDWNTLSSYKIPVPSIQIQKEIINILNSYNSRKQISDILSSKIKNICSLLIKGSMKEANNE